MRGKIAKCVGVTNTIDGDSPFRVSHGQGSYIWTHSGKKLLDFTCGISTSNTGHCHPRVVKAVQDQAAKGMHLQQNICRHDFMLEVPHKLTPLLPEGFDTFTFGNSGAEAVEAAVKLARAHTRRSNVVCFQGAFHGRTYVAMNMTQSSAKYFAPGSDKYGPVVVAPFPAINHWAGDDVHRIVEETFESFEDTFKHGLHPESVAVVVVELVQGEGGYFPIPSAFLRKLKDWCDQHGILLAFDEVQTGYCRTGKFFAYEHEASIKPDIMILGKGIAGGLPLSAVVAPDHIYDSLPPSSHGGTYGGNAVCMAAASTTIDVLLDENCAANTTQRGDWLAKQLLTLRNQFPFIGDIRQRGVMIGIDVVDPKAELPKKKNRNPTLAKSIQTAAIEQGLLMFSPCGTWGHSLRFMPACTVSQAECEEAIELFRKALGTLNF